LSIVRVREHVNPLSRKYQAAAEMPDWSAVYGQLNQPLHLDIGCGWGKFVLQMAQVQPGWNFLGLEIRQPLVDQANQWRDEQALSNVHFLFCNANTTLRPLLLSLPQGRLQRVTIQFPDPWFKRRHQKRRVVQPELVAVLAEFLPPGAEVLIQSDVEAVAIAMRQCLAAHPGFRQSPPNWLERNPLPVATEREQVTLAYGDSVYRAVFVRQDGDRRVR
jgi:tRNA (guanine-N7-)-methyltransferase